MYIFIRIITRQSVKVLNQPSLLVLDMTSISSCDGFTFGRNDSLRQAAGKQPAISSRIEEVGKHKHRYCRIRLDVINTSNDDATLAFANITVSRFVPVEEISTSMYKHSNLKVEAQKHYSRR